ncbi:multiple sugar transport system permease protein [Actinoplanes lutulentus]|uniref:Carbohydrate ABC transporter membrane protein 2 (CUT1 family) n=1 Tax=Actinoplanes lutulentus TaxID=1287878 RepID=A0A327ZJR6_9ACTN|nr:carbohydrate ABC transporter permease [Actinoplanes lutulentus]MBB2940878.1 multiple sugar transport system permease protein [Actinoplanes lutulentus]RAK43187.1 carbohydrate ABC transporter membrane protein 2 (CUT1 family) [Actinoplanes lutulentus]
MKVSRRTQVYWILGALAVIAYALVPVFWIVSLSFKEGDDITNNSFLPTVWSWANYRTVFASDLFTTALRNSVGMAIIATTISVVLATLAAYAISRLEFPGKRLVLGVALAITVFPVIAIATPLFNLWRTIGLYDTWLGLIIPYLSYSLPLAVYVLAAFFREIPWEMEQAAQVDGATAWQAFRRVIVPLASPGVFTAAILTFFAVWNDFVFGITLTSSEAARPVPAALAFFQGASQFSQPTAPIAAAAVVVTIPVVILVLLFQRKIVAGLTSGAVKG